MNDDMDSLLTIGEVANLLGVSRKAIYAAIAEQRLQCVIRYERKLVRRSDVEQYRARTQPDGRPIYHRPVKVKALRSNVFDRC